MAARDVDLRPRPYVLGSWQAEANEVLSAKCTTVGLGGGADGPRLHSLPSYNSKQAAPKKARNVQVAPGGGQQWRHGAQLALEHLVGGFCDEICVCIVVA